MKELNMRQKIIWIEFCLYLFIIINVNTMIMHIIAVLYLFAWSSTSAVLIFPPPCAEGMWTECTVLTAGCENVCWEKHRGRWERNQKKVQLIY